MAGAEFPVRAVLDDRGIDQLIAALTKAGKAAGMTDEQINKLNDDLRKTGREGTGSVNNLNKSLDQSNKLAGMAKTAIAGIITAQSIKMVADFVWEVSQLAAKADGVRQAFNKLPHSIKLMDDLKRATMGTVSELTLMQRAVQANQFNISLEKLPVMLEFAMTRAKQTGQSIDYLVDSIVTGLGRKSVMILDNLGISATAIREEIERVGDFSVAVGNIIERESEKQGHFVENNISKTARLAASYENLKVAIGDAANGTGVLGSVMDELTTIVDNLASKNLSWWQKLVSLRGGVDAMVVKGIDMTLQTAKLTEEQKKYEQVLREVDRAMASGNAEAYINAQKQHIYYTEILAEYTKRLNAGREEEEARIENIKNLTLELNSLQEQQQVLTGNQLEQVNKEIEAVQAKIKALKELGVEKSKDNKKTTETIGLIAHLEEKLKDLKKARREAFSVEEIAKFNREIAVTQRELNQLMSGESSLETAFRKTEEGWDEVFAKSGDDAIARVGKAMKAFTDEYKKQAKERTAAEKKHLQEVEEARRYALDTGIALMQAGFDYRVRLVQQEIEALDYQRQRELEQAGTNEEAKAAINKRFDAQRAQLMRKQAQREQQAALFQMAINQGPAIAKTAATLGYPWAIPFIAAVAALFALQTTNTRSAQPPRFKDGVFKLKGPGTETSDSIPAYLSKNESVIPAAQTSRYASVVRAMVEGTDADVRRAMALQLRGDLFHGTRATDTNLGRKLDELKEAVENKRETYIGINENGFTKWTRKGHQWTEYVGRRYSA